ncbi:MAG: 4-oxalomesaconate tautomerase [Burkholderiales bacterium]|nr:4-oxalomesaconate tautomerase [Burkholderiales bacterium]
MITRIPAYLYRGGTSKGPLILAADLPADIATLDRVLLAAMGSPHKRQIDGIGGAETLTSKIAVVSKSARRGVDVDYLFVQVNPESAVVDYSSNCGNMLSAVGPFALEMGLVSANDPHTRVSIYNINTHSIIEVILHTPGGEVTYDGDAAIDGVPGTAAPVKQNFARTIGSKSGKLLPTGRVSETIDGVEVTCIDVAVPMVIVPAASVGKTGHESKAELDPDAALIARLERIRVEAGKRMGLGDCSRLVVPKPVLVAAPRRGGTIASRDFVPFNCHATYSVTGSMALSAACVLPGTAANRLAVLRGTTPEMVRIEHPGGVIEVEVRSRMSAQGLVLDEASLLRTCRKLFEGQVCIPARVWDGSGKASSAAAIGEVVCGSADQDARG